MAAGDSSQGPGSKRHRAGESVERVGGRYIFFKGSSPVVPAVVNEDIQIYD
jgi:hypothetical protein